MREEYFSPVGFAKEPAVERKRWFGRILTLLFVVFIIWLAWTKVIHPPSDNPIFTPTQQTQLPNDSG